MSKYATISALGQKTLKVVKGWKVVVNEGGMSDTNKIVGYYLHKELAELDTVNDYTAKVLPCELWIDSDDHIFLVEHVDGDIKDWGRDKDAEIMNSIHSKLSDSEIAYLGLVKRDNEQT